ncbi:hypothetical protein MA47_03140 [Corynebacterium auriscanis]|uniref:Uncharacterized protein n=1 Tax=Corynebacterium auriscanis TaxID=99807 RepID=A0A0A2DMJ4_9CORY|nr:hypothetical protein MA47_03140 [Corynebacterium auriscanis]
MRAATKHTGTIEASDRSRTMLDMALLGSSERTVVSTSAPARAVASVAAMKTRICATKFRISAKASALMGWRREWD